MLPKEIMPPYSPHKYNSHLDMAISAAKSAGLFLQDKFHQGYDEKLDIVADRMIADVLRNAYPEYGYLSEELGMTSPGTDPHGHLWLVDPHDGTSAAERGYRGTAVSIALLRKGEPVLGVVFTHTAPDDDGDLICWAEGTGPVRRNGVEVQRTWPLKPSSACTMLVSQSADPKAPVNIELTSPMRYRAVASVAYRFALVGAGDGDVGLSLASPVSWDIAAGHAILRGAGGDVFDTAGVPVRYNMFGENTEPLFACYGGIAQLVKPFVGKPWLRALTVPIDPSTTEALVYLKPGKTMFDAALLSRAQGCLLGQLSGDALGSLVEFQSAESIAKRYPTGPNLLTDGGTWNTIAGQPTDDSEMALTLARSIVRGCRYDAEAAAHAYVDWFESSPFDIGNTTRNSLSALSRLRASGASLATHLRSGSSDASEANGALMRISPLGIFGFHTSPEVLAQLAVADAQITHPSRVCTACNEVFAVTLARAIAHGPTPDVLYKDALQFAEQLSGAEAVVDRLRQAATQPPKSYSGHVLNAIQNAFFQLLHADSLESALVNTVRAGEDTDTNAAITGALLGAVYGRNAIPAQWSDRLFSCRPLRGAFGVQQPRPPRYWPVDALVLAERLLIG